MEQFVYADNAATTKLSPAVLEAMMPYLTEEYGNPSSLYRFGNHAKRAIEQARKEVADALGAEPFEILFTGCGSRGRQLGLKEIMRSLTRPGAKTTSSPRRWSTTPCCTSASSCRRKALRSPIIPVDREGPDRPGAGPRGHPAGDRPCLDHVRQQRDRHHLAHRGDRRHLPPGRGAVPHRRGAGGRAMCPSTSRRMNIDMLSLSAHKFHGPKGVGACYCRQRAFRCPTCIDGGAQERGQRAGTENVAGIVGLGAALRARQRRSMSAKPAPG